MKKHTLIYAMGIGIFAISSLLSFNHYQQVDASESTTLDLVNCITSIHDNNLNDIVDNELFDYGLRHGALNIGDKTGIIPGCYKFDSTGSNENYIYSSDDRFPGYFDWAGQRYHFSGYDGLIFKIVAKENISIKTSITADHPAGWVDHCQLWYFVSSNYDEESKNWIGKDAIVKKIELYPSGGSKADKEEFVQTIKLKAGQTFYWEYSWNWHDTRNIELGHTGFKFLIEEDNYTPKVVTSETYKYLNMIENVCSVNGNDVNPNMGTLTTLTTYGFRHGDVSFGNVEKFNEHATTWLGPRNNDVTKATFMENWRFNTVNGDAAIIYIKAEKDIRLNIDRGSFGNDVREGLTFNIYKNTEKVYSHLFDGKNDSPNDFSYSLMLNKDEYVYFEFMHYGSGFSLISMGNDGNDMSTLPSFTAVEASDINYEELSLANIVEQYNAPHSGDIELSNKSATYGVYQGDFESNNLAPMDVFEQYLSRNGAKLTKNNIVINNDSLTFKISANINLCIYLDIIPDNFVNENFNVKVYRFIATKNKTKKYLDINFKDNNSIDQITDNIICDKDDIIYIEFTSLDGEISFNNLKNVCFLEKCIGDGVKSSYPLYEATDYSSKESFTHKEIAFESARIKCEPIKTNKFSIQLLTGKVKEDFEQTYKFSNIMYESGEYVGSSESPSMRLTNGNDSFDGDNYAAVEDYRLKTCSIGGVIYKIVANVDTALEVTHPATTSGWIGEGAESSFGYYQGNGSTIKKLDSKPINQAVNEEDTFAYTYHLKAGDVAYLIFDEEVATQRNLNIAFNFKINEAAYNPEIREEIFGKASVEVRMENVVTDMMNNNCLPVSYSECLKVNLAHGKVKEPTQFLREDCEGDGSGSANDALVNGSDGALLAKFFRWQIRAGVSNDSSIMIFTALKDLHLVITHPANKDAWSTSSSFRYYYADVDYFLDFKEERFVSSDLGDNYFGYDCHLKEGQSLVISYSSNDESNFGVVDVCWIANATTDDFDASKVNDFTEGRRVQSVKDEYQGKLDEQISKLKKSDYSISNWGKIEDYYSSYNKRVDDLTKEEDIVKEYITAEEGIKLVKTIEEEKQELIAYKAGSIEEAENYLRAKMNNFNKQTQQEAQEILSSFEESVLLMDNKTDIKLALISFKSSIDALPTNAGLSTGALVGIICGSIGGALLIGGGVTGLVIYKKKKKAK